MKKFALFFLFFTHCSLLIFAQQNVDSHLSKGIDFYDAGNFSAAIKEYQKALKIDPKSPIVHYEISLAYIAQEDYKNALKHANKVLTANIDKTDKLREQAFIIKGTSLDLSGKRKNAIKSYSEGILDFPKSQLLYYNLGFSYYKHGALSDAEKATINSLKIHPEHTSSHLLLGAIKADQNNRVEALLAYYHFLLLEPTGSRSAVILSEIEKMRKSSVKKNKDNEFLIQINSESKSEFVSLELLLSLFSSGINIPGAPEKTDFEIFYDYAYILFSTAGNFKEDKSSFWWDFYVDFFQKMHEENHVLTFCHLIYQSKKDKNSISWLKENEDKVKDFSNWYVNYQRIIN